MIVQTTTAMGALDVPRDGDIVEGPVVTISGWVVMGGWPADVIEVSVDGGPAIRCRRCEPRLDIEIPDTVPFGVGEAAGFNLLLPVVHREVSHQIDIQLTARGESGGVWEYPPIRVTVTAASAVEELTPTSIRTWSRHAGSGLSRVAPGSRPRVCAMTHSLSLGGGELYLQELLLRLRADHDIDLMVVSAGDGPLRADLEAAGIPVHITAPTVLLPGHYESQVVELGSLMALWDCDVAITNTVGMFIFVDAARWAERPVIWAVHESFPLGVFEHLNWGQLHPAIRSRWHSCLREGAHVVFEAEATKALYEREVPGIRASCVRYGIDLTAIEDYQRTHDRDALRAELGFGPDDLVLLCVGVFQQRKQQLALVHAFSAFVDAHPRASLVLMGNHPSAYATAVRRQVDAFGLAERIMVIDIDPDTYRYYQCADVLVSASDTESLPRSVLEAMAFGVPVLSTDVFGVAEVVQDGVHGWLCESASGVSLLAAFRRAITASAEERSAMSARCREAARGFSGEGYAAHYAALIRSMQADADGPEMGLGAARGYG